MVSENYGKVIRCKLALVPPPLTIPKNEVHRSSKAFLSENKIETVHPRPEGKEEVGNKRVRAVLKGRKAETERGGGRDARYYKYHENYCLIVKTERRIVSYKHSACEPNQKVREKVGVVIRNYGLVCIRPRV